MCLPHFRDILISSNRVLIYTIIFPLFTTTTQLSFITVDNNSNYFLFNCNTNQFMLYTEYIVSKVDDLVNWARKGMYDDTTVTSLMLSSLPLRRRQCSNISK